MYKTSINRSEEYMRKVTVHPPKTLDIDRVMEYDSLETPFFTIVKTDDGWKIQFTNSPSWVSVSDEKTLRKLLRENLESSNILILCGWKKKKVLYGGELASNIVSLQNYKRCFTKSGKVCFEVTETEWGNTIIYSDFQRNIFINYYVAGQEEPEIIKYVVDGDYGALVQHILPGAKTHNIEYVSVLKKSSEWLLTWVVYRDGDNYMRLHVEDYGDHVEVSGVVRDDGVYEVIIPKTNKSDDFVSCNGCYSERIIDHAGISAQRIYSYATPLGETKVLYWFKWGLARVIYKSNGQKIFQVHLDRKWFTIPEAVFYRKLSDIKNLDELRALLSLL